MKALQNKLIVYDSSCRVCSSLIEVMLKFTLVPHDKIKAYKDLSLNLHSLIDPERFKNEIALVDTSGAATLYGPEGVVYIISSRYSLLGQILRIRMAFYVFSLLYRTIAYNRYIIAIPDSRFHCDCFPDKVMPYRVAYIILTTFLSALLLMCFGIALGKFLAGVPAVEAAGKILLVAGVGGMFQVLLAGIFMRENKIDYIGHLGSIVTVGLLLLIPWTIFYAISGFALPWLPIISTVICMVYMLYLHVQRVKYLQISTWWNVNWLLSLLLAVFIMMRIFHVK